jgi:hypothetical protein
MKMVFKIMSGWVVLFFVLSGLSFAGMGGGMGGGSSCGMGEVTGSHVSDRHHGAQHQEHMQMMDQIMQDSSMHGEFMNRMMRDPDFMNRMMDRMMQNQAARDLMFERMMKDQSMQNRLRQDICPMR